MLQKTIDRFPNGGWDWGELSKTLPLQYILSRPDYEWYWYWISLRTDLTWSDVQSTFKYGTKQVNFFTIKIGPRIEWNWNALTGIVPWEFVRDNITEYDWDRDYIHRNAPYFVVEKVWPDTNHEWSRFSENTNIPWSIFSRPNVLRRLHWYFLSKNKSITWDIIIGNPNCPWEWDSLHLNPSITFENFENNLDRAWNWKFLSINLGNLKQGPSKLVPFNFKGNFYDFLYNHPEILEKWDWTLIAGRNDFELCVADRRFEMLHPYFNNSFSHSRWNKIVECMIKYEEKHIAKQAILQYILDIPSHILENKL